MGDMVFDAMHLSLERRRRKRLAEFSLNRLPLRLIANAIHDRPYARPAAKHKGELLAEMRGRIRVHRDMFDIADRSARLVQTIADRFAWKPGPMLDAPEALLLSSSDDLAISYETGGRVAVVSVDSQNKHKWVPCLAVF